MSKTKKKSIWSELELSTNDGRRQRSDRSRRKIIQAMFELMGEGDMTPTAVSVAAKADVGLRTVFRHFEDMDSIFEEMTEEAASIVQPRIVAPFESTHWRDRLVELAERNAETFELVFPMQVALVLRRFQSSFLQRQYQREVHLIRSSIKAILPPKVARNKILFSTLETCLNFATWRRLREDQNLSVKEAKTALVFMVNALVADVDE